MRRLLMGLAGVLMAGVISVIPSAAHAETTLCVGTSVKSTMKCDSGWAVNMMFMHWRMYRGHNCTNYVAWRLGRDGVQEPNYLLGNASSWAKNAKKHGVPVDEKPEVGAVGAWSGRNHVVYVDQVGSNWLLLTEDSYSQKRFRRFTVTKGERNYPTRFIHFRGKNAITGTTPTISGDLEVGKTLTAKIGTWSPKDVKLRYQWLRDGVVIKNATGTTYRLVKADAGHKMSISVTGTHKGKLPRTTSSLQTREVSAGTIKPGTVRITGLPMRDQKLTAVTGGWQPADIGLNYQWFADGKAIKKATDRTLSLKKKQKGKKITVRVTAFGPGYKAVPITSAPTAKVVKDGETVGAVTAGVPAITGPTTYMVGDRLKASAGTWTPDSVKTTVQWMRDGKAIKDATKWDYKLTDADLGKTLRVDVVGTRTYYTTAKASSAATPVIKPHKLQAVMEPTLSGKTVMGSTLTVQPGTWAPDGVKTSIVWTRDGKVISGKSATTYVLTEQDVKHVVGAIVTAKRDGFDKETRTLAAPDAVQAIPQFKTTWEKSSEKRTKVLKVSMTALGKPIGGKVRIEEKGAKVGTIKLDDAGRGTYAYKAKKGKHKLRLTFEGEDWLTRPTKDVEVEIS
jgi:surface antigen